MKNSSRLFLVLSISVLGVIAVANAQKSPTANRIGIANANAAFDMSADYGTENEEKLRKYSTISALAMSQRKAAFRNASSEEKSELWRTHLALFLVNRADLTELQKEIVLDAMALATPDWFQNRSKEGTGKANVDTRLRSLEARMFAAFSKEDRVRIFATLGGESAQCVNDFDQRSIFRLKTLGYNASSNSFIFNPWISNRPVWQEIELDKPNCECSTESDWCPMASLCRPGNCSTTDSGCGTLWSYPCNGATCDDGKPTPSPTPTPKPSPSLQETSRTYEA